MWYEFMLKLLDMSIF